MSIATSCPECKHNFILPDNLMGKRIKCKNCTAVFRVGGEKQGDEFDTMSQMAAKPDDFATQFPLRGEGHKGDDFATQYPLKGGKDDFATQYPLKAGKDEFATADMKKDDFATNFAMKTEPGWDGVEAPSGKKDDHFGAGDASDTKTEWDEPVAPGPGKKPPTGMTPAASDTATDMAASSNDTAKDFLPEPKPPGLTQLPPEQPRLPSKGKLIGAGLPKGQTKPVKLPGKGKLPGAAPDKTDLGNKAPEKTDLGRQAPDKTDLGRKAPAKVAPAGEIAPTKKGANKLVLGLIVFLALDAAALAALVYVPQAREAAGLKGQAWINDIARSVGGHVDGSDKPPTVPPGNAPQVPQPDEPKPVDPEPDVPKPVEPKPEEPKPVEPKPEEPKPVEPKPEEPKPVEPKPEEPKPVEPKPEEPKPVEPKPEEPKPVEPKPEEPKPVEPKPEEPKPVEPKPEEPKPVEPKPEEPKPEEPKPEEPKPEEPKPEEPKPVEPKPEEPKPEEPKPDQPKPADPIPLPDAPKPEVKQPEVDPFKSAWPKFERKAPAPAKPGAAKDYFNEDFSGTMYDWKWLPSGTRVASPKPGIAGALEVDANKQFQMQGSVADGEIRMTVWRDMSDADRRVHGAGAKGYEVQFRYVSANDYHALQVRGDGHYRIVRVSGGKTTTLVGDSKGDYVPLPGWDRNAEYDEIVLNFRGKNVFGMFGGKRLGSTEAAGEAAGKVGVKTVNGLAIAIEKFSVNE